LALAPEPDLADVLKRLGQGQDANTMKLYFSQTSPYARKVRLAAAHLGLADAIALVPATTTPIAEDPAVAAANPLAKIPALALDDGTVLFDSRVIVEYLDAHAAKDGAGGGLLPPSSDPERWQTLRLQAIADGLLDAALLSRYEVALRPGEFLWRDWLAGQGRKIDRALAALEADVARLESGAALNGIAAACALGYLDFRFPDRGWRKAAPKLGAFFDAYAQRPEMALTDPTAT
jgi:glutathione S-transferase